MLPRVVLWWENFVILFVAIQRLKSETAGQEEQIESGWIFDVMWFKIQINDLWRGGV